LAKKLTAWHYARMTHPTISAVAAIGQNQELGQNNELIWRIPADLRRLKALTTGHPIIMGRKTYQSIGQPLPNRTNIVISRQADFSAPGCTVVPSLEAALQAARKVEEEEIFIFGGGAIYELAWPQIEKLYLTIIHDSQPDADAHFPTYQDDFIETAREAHATDDGLLFDWVTLMRIGNK
jgi:dihydrofolate reductase